MLGGLLDKPKFTKKYLNCSFRFVVIVCHSFYRYLLRLSRSSIRPATFAIPYILFIRTNIVIIIIIIIIKSFYHHHYHYYHNVFAVIKIIAGAIFLAFKTTFLQFYFSPIILFLFTFILNSFTNFYYY